MQHYSGFGLIKHAMSHHENWQRVWRNPKTKSSYIILKKSSSYNVSPNNFSVGKVVTTVFAKSQAVIRRTGDDGFQLIIRRSFSDYIWKWIVDAGSRE